MKIGLFSDAHGNIKALRDCYDALARIRVDKIFFLGDAVGYLPFAADCLEFLMSRDVECIKGNHEAMLLGDLPLTAEKDEFYKIAAIREKISPELLGFIAGWKNKIEITDKERRFLFVHGSPDDYLGGYIYPDTDLSQYKNIAFDVVAMGQTHRPFIRHEYNKIFVNTGSVGLPRDAGNMSSFAVLETVNLQTEIFRKHFDSEYLLADKDVHPRIKDVFSRRESEIYGKVLE